MNVDSRFEDAIKAYKNCRKAEAMEIPVLRPDQIKQIIIKETKSKFYGDESPTKYDDEFTEMLNCHIKNMENRLQTYEDINSWLLSFRRLSLIEWVESL